VPRPLVLFLLLFPLLPGCDKILPYQAGPDGTPARDAPSHEVGLHEGGAPGESPITDALVPSLGVHWEAASFCGTGKLVGGGASCSGESMLFQSSVDGTGGSWTVRCTPTGIPTEYVACSDTAMVQQASGSPSAACPDGKGEVGGGCDCGGVAITASFPPQLSTWKCACESAVAPTAYVRCADASYGVQSKTQSFGSALSRFIDCDPGEVLIGGGCYTGFSGMPLRASRPDPPPPETPLGWYCEASAATPLTVYALCGH
jgi:hypothetical protein